MSSELITIESTGLLSNEKFRELTELESKIIKGCENRIIFRAPYLMQVSVLDDVKHPTPDAKYWQANLERSVMYQNLVMLSFDYMEIEADIEIKKALIGECMEKDTPLSLARANKHTIQIEKLQTQLVAMKKEADDRLREVIGWTEIMDDLEPHLEFSKTDQNEHMAKSYPLRFAQQQKIIQQIGASDMNGAMNVIGLCQTAFNNPETIKLINKEKK